MKLAVSLCLLLIQIQDAGPAWKLIANLTDSKGDEWRIYARDCLRYTDTESEIYPKLCIKTEREPYSRVRGRVAEFDCTKRLIRTRLYEIDDDIDLRVENPKWETVASGSTNEKLVDYACRDKSKDKE